MFFPLNIHFLFCFVLVSTAPQQKPVSTYLPTYIHLHVKSTCSLLSFSNCNINSCFFVQFFTEELFRGMGCTFFVPFSVINVVMYINVKDMFIDAWHS